MNQFRSAAFPGPISRRVIQIIVQILIFWGPKGPKNIRNANYIFWEYFSRMLLPPREN